MHRPLRFELHPPHRARLLRRRAVVRVRHQQRRDELLRLLAHRAPLRLVELKRAAHDQTQRREVVRLRKRRVPAQPTRHAAPRERQDVRDHAQRPEVHRRTVAFPADNLGRRVPGRSADGAERVRSVGLFVRFPRGYVSGESEIGDLDVVPVVGLREQDVFGL